MLKVIQDINARHSRMTPLMSPLGSRPAPWQAPHAHPVFETVGEHIGVNGTEIQIMMDHALKIKDPTCIKLFERFLMAAKMVSSEPLAAHHEVRRQVRQRHEQAIEKYDRKVEALKRQNENIIKSNEQLVLQITRRWHKMITYLTNKISMGTELTEEELAVYDSLVACLQVDTSTGYQVVLDACRDFSFYEIMNTSRYIEDRLTETVSDPNLWTPDPDYSDSEDYPF